MSPSTPPRILFGASSLAPGAGGIQRVGRLMLLALHELLPEKEAIRCVALDDVPPKDVSVPVTAARGSVLRFAWEAVRRAGCTHLVTDACNIGQVHRLPGLRRKPLLTFLHGIEIWETAKPRWVAIARAADVQLFNSGYTLARAERTHGPFPRAKVCWLATEADEPPGYTACRDRPEVLIVGRMMNRERFKGHQELIETWPAVSAAVPGAVLRIVGTGPGEPVYRELARKSSAAAGIVFEGFVTEARLEDLYARSAVFAMPSREEGFGLVYIEAMRHGLPVIGSTHDAAPEVVTDGKTGFTVDLNKGHAELTERLIYLLRDPDAAGRMGAAGRARWAEHFRYSGFKARFGPIASAFLARR